MATPANRRGAEPLLRGEGLVRHYDGRRVVDVEALAVHGGEVLALLGPNGAGKSTLLRLLAGLESPDEGCVYFKGRRVVRRDRETRQASVAVMQRPYLWRGTVRQNVEYGLRLRGVSSLERRTRVRAGLEMLGVAELAEVSVATLSGGETQRVALARALVLEPEVLFLDEPTADLDVAVRRRLLTDLERILRRIAPAIVLITHDPGEAFALADRVAVIEGGRIIQTGAPADVFEAPASEFVASFTGAEFMLNGEVEASDQDTVLIRLDSGQALEVAGKAEPGARVRVAYRPEDVVIGPLDSSTTSARNRFVARLARLHPQGGLVRVRLESDGLSLEALITRRSLEGLDLRVGKTVVAQIKATAFHIFPL
jgi:molybdopterin-binding protein